MAEKTPDKRFSQAEVDAIVTRRLSKERRKWERNRAGDIERAVQLAIKKLQESK